MSESKPASRPASAHAWRQAGVYERGEACLEAGLGSASTDVLRLAGVYERGDTCPEAGLDSTLPVQESERERDREGAASLADDPD